MKVAVSIPDSIFGAADRLAKERHVPRSQLFADALREYVARHSADAVTAKLNAIYADEESVVEPALAHAQLSTVDNEAW